MSANEVILDKWNGRKTVYVTSNNDDATLHWLMFGHVENFDIWLRLPLTVIEAQDVILNPPKLYDGYIVELSPRVLTLQLTDGVKEYVRVDYRTGASDMPTVAALKLLQDMLDTDMSIPRDFADEVSKHLEGTFPNL